MSVGISNIARRKEVAASPVTGIMGELGGIIVSNTSANTGEWNCIYPITNTVIASCTTPDFTGSLAGVTLSAGIPFYGKVTALTLTSGTCVLYVRTTSMEF